MNEQDAWNKFFISGSVRDYLNYKSIEQKTKQKNKADNEIHHTGTDNQTTEYR